MGASKNEPMVGFRVDASIEMGTGHLMRCLTLADSLIDCGFHCRFVCRAHRGHLMDLIAERGHMAISLPVLSEVAHDSLAHRWLGADWRTDARETSEALDGLGLDWLVVDHYAVDARWEADVRAVVGRVMAIDDLADRPHHCDLLLDQNLGRSQEDYAPLCPSSCTKLVGPKYALLRPEFAALRHYSLSRRQAPRLERLLITMGGVDNQNITGRILIALRECALPAEACVTVVLGQHAPSLSLVRQQAATMPWPTEVLVGISDMARLMAESDLAIGAAGSTAWERCCLGLPSIQVVLADNQKGIALALERAQAAVTVEMATLESYLVEMFESRVELESRMRALSAAARHITDGHGAVRVATEMQRSVN